MKTVYKNGPPSHLMRTSSTENYELRTDYFIKFSHSTCCVIIVQPISFPKSEVRNPQSDYAITKRPIVCTIGLSGQSSTISRPAQSSVAVSKESEEVFDFGGGGEFLFHFEDGIVQFEAGTENEAIGLFQVALHFGADVISGEAYGVEAYDSGGIAVYNNEGAYVLDDFGHAANHGTGTDFDKLMDTAHASDDCMVFYGDVTGCSGEGAHDDMIPKVAVMGHMGVSLEHIVGAYPGFTIFAGGSVDGDVFTNQVMIAENDGGVFTGKFQVLRVFADDGMGVNMVFFPHPYVFRNDGVSPDDGAFPDFAVFANHCVRSDDDIFMNDGGRIDDGGGMNIRFC